MDKQDLIIEMVKGLKKDFCEFRTDNKTEHENIKKDYKEEFARVIRRQDHTNGSVAKIKKGQLILWTAVITSFTLLTILGFLPERVYNIIAKAF